jgi:gliding motility-associated-like protein
VKDNLNIEKLFKDKFENFEGNVNPDLWTNISKGISSNAAVSSSIGLGVKALIIGVSAVTVGITAYFVGDFNQPIDQIVDNTISVEVPVSIEQVKAEQNIENKTTETISIIADDNDPVIAENKAEIIEQLTNTERVEESDVFQVNNSEEEIQESDMVSEVTELIDDVELDKVEVNNETDISPNKAISIVEEDDIIELSEPIIPNGKIEYTVNSNLFKYGFKSNARSFEKISWSFGDGQISNEENPTHLYHSVGVYSVELTIVSEDNYIYSETKTIEIKTTSSIDNIPNVITPNGDRINDQFVIKTTDISEFSITITDQFGKTVFQSNDKNFIWDGNDMSGNLVEKAIYTYYILAKGNDGAILKIPGQLYVR